VIGLDRPSPPQNPTGATKSTHIQPKAERLLSLGDALLAAGVGLLAGCVYWLGAAPDVLFGDGGELQLAAWTAGLPHPTGYPLYMLLGLLWSHLLTGLDVVATPARAMNLLSVFLAGLVVALTYLLAHALVELSVPGASRRAQRFSSLLAALIFAFSPTFWSQAVVTEVYALHAVFVALLLGFALRWQKGLDQERRALSGPAAPQFRMRPSTALMLVAVTLGLALTHHRTSVLLIPVLLVFVWRQDGYRLRRPRWLLILVGLALLPLLLYLYIPARVNHSAYLSMELKPGQLIDLINRSPRGLVGYALGRSFAGQLQGLNPVMDALPSLPERFLAELTPVGVGLALLGLGYLIATRQRRLLWLTLGSFLFLTGFNLFYAIEDIAVFYIPSYLIAVCWIAVAGAFVAQETARLAERWFADRPRLVTGVSLAVLLLLAALPVSLFLDHASQIDRSGHTRPREWWTRILESQIAPNAVLITNDRDEMMPLWYMQQVEGVRPDIIGLYPGLIPGENWADVGAVVDNAFASGRPLYLIKPMEGLEVKVDLGLNDATGVTPVLGPAAATAPERSQNALFGEEIRLVGYDVAPVHPQPGQMVQVDLYWQPVKAISQDLTSFLHLRASQSSGQGDGGGQEPPILSQSDRLVGGAYYPSSLWKPGEILVDRHRLVVPEDAPSGPYELLAGLYELVGQEALTIGSVVLDGRIGGEAPAASRGVTLDNPLYANFKDEILLIGYEVAGGRLAAVDGLPVSPDQTLSPDELNVQLLWQSARPAGKDYTVFVHLVDPTGSIVAQQDVQPFSGSYPTSVWQQGELLADSYTINLPNDLAPGPYRLVAGLYHAPTGKRLAGYNDRGQRLPNDQIEVVEIDLE
jgi:hypothetical protein